MLAHSCGLPSWALGEGGIRREDGFLRNVATRCAHTAEHALVDAGSCTSEPSQALACAYLTPAASCHSISASSPQCLHSTMEIFRPAQSLRSKLQAHTLQLCSMAPEQVALAQQAQQARCTFRYILVDSRNSAEIPNPEIASQECRCTEPKQEAQAEWLSRLLTLPLDRTTQDRTLLEAGTYPCPCSASHSQPLSCMRPEFGLGLSCTCAAAAYA